MNSALSDDNRIKRILYYPSTKDEFNSKIFDLPYTYYLTKGCDAGAQRRNVYVCPNAISGFLAIDFYCVIINNPLSQFQHAIDISSQLHIPLIFLCTEPPPANVKKESVFYINQQLEKSVYTICSSQELADKWYLTEYKITSSLNDIPEILKEWTMVYKRR